LKILENNPEQNSFLQNKVQNKFNQWMNNGKILVYGRPHIESKSLPEELQWELSKIYAEPIKRVLKKANRQIRETKRSLSMPKAKGMVIIVNEANISLPPEHLAFSTYQATKDNYSNIDTVCLLTANLTIKLNNHPSSTRIWLDYVCNTENPIDNNFIHTLKLEWINTLNKILYENIQYREIKDFKELIGINYDN
jgi:sucrose-6-phosphate hydrolase SacC (GH32 family)